MPDPESRESKRPDDADGTLLDGATTTGGVGDKSRGETWVPERIGGYHVIGLLGAGGMGVVYEAEQQSPKRRVALKVVGGGRYVDDRLVRMFQREVETLARLKHPTIGGIYESGRTDDGKHFFAMELVRGETLDAYIAGRPPLATAGELRFRLGLFAKIAEAVHYAHQRAVIHRDLKPSNIVVNDAAAQSDSGVMQGPRLPEVKVLDFGLARITEGDVAATMVSEVGVIKGTLPYMSPEQARGNPEEIDLRSDVYALGVLLYEMLAGSRPYDVSKKSLVEAVRVICEQPPAPLQRSLAGGFRIDSDLETILGKALEKDADRRYGSAAAFLEDVNRYLASQPILARPPSTTYQLKKLIARNRLAAVLASTVLLLLVAFAGIMAFQAQRLARERDRSRAEAAKATAINDFLQTTLASADPWSGGERDVTIIEALDAAAAKIDGAFPDQPLIEAAVRESIGATYRAYGRWDESEALFRRALEIREANQPADHTDLARTHAHLASLFVLAGRYDEARETARVALAIQRRATSPRSEEVAARLTDYSDTLNFSGQYAEAEEVAREATEIYREVFGDRHENVAQSLENLATAIWYQGELDRAESIAGESVALWREVEVGEHPAVVNSLTALGMIRLQLGDLEGARPLLEEAVERRRSMVGDDHPEMATALENLGNLHFRAGRADETIRLLEQVLEMRKRMLGKEHMAVGRTLANMAALYKREGRREEAAESYREAIRLLRAGLGDEHPDLAHVLAGMAGLLRQTGDLSGAEGALRDALSIRQRAFAEDHELVAATRIDLGLVLLEMGDRRQAEPLLVRGKADREAARGSEDPRVRKATEALEALR